MQKVSKQIPRKRDLHNPTISV